MFFTLLDYAPASKAIAEISDMIDVYASSNRITSGTDRLVYQ